ncbi:hypothetical protein L3Q82_000299 [Scortum barcoo]|uniref:Uncharacterized protein n=1 Tax=Scortum barcoo TaxID=214431 RepID=A0ACB8XAH4_9TELE|nr:hypothetical protein L3Q82_000299 [Scortum barcoo]
MDNSWCRPVSRRSTICSRRTDMIAYSRMILKYFLAEGVVCRHELFVAAAQDNPDDILQELPAPILDDVAMHKPVEQPRLSCEPQDSLDAMKIAWRYQNLPKVQSALASSSRFGHYYDVSKTMEPEIRQAAKCHRFYLPEHPNQASTAHSTMLESYSALLKSLQEVIHKEGFDVAAPMDRALMGSITRLCDNAVALESFKGSERETNPLYKDYHGLLHVRQIPHLNCLASKLPDHKDLAFKLKRKQFSIERLHLPPDLSETSYRTAHSPTGKKQSPDVPRLSQSLSLSSSLSSSPPHVLCLFSTLSRLLYSPVPCMCEEHCRRAMVEWVVTG